MSIGDSVLMRRVAELGYRRSAFRARSRKAIEGLTKVRDNINSSLELLSTGKRKEAKESARELLVESAKFLDELITEFQKQ